jgi:DNA repair protein RadD
MSIPILRDYQKKIIDDTYSAWKTHQNVSIQLATGGGKTCVFCHIIANHVGKTCVIAHRVEILAQISLTLASYRIPHNLITRDEKIRECIALQMQELNASFISTNSSVYVIGVDTLIRSPHLPWIPYITLIIQDEAHHVLRDNKWGKAAALFPHAKGLYPTATPVRADGRGLGRHADGVVDALITVVSMRELINQGFLTDYTVFSPKSDVQLSHIPISSDGDYNQERLRSAVKRSHIVGDVVLHYQRIAPGKLGLTFAVDIESAATIADAYRQAGIPAEVISGKTNALVRAQLMRRFSTKDILQLVSVDIMGEGVDVPAIEVVTFARPTMSYTVYCQQFGRALRPMPGKEKAIIIDHVDNIVRHGLPDDLRREWSLDRRERQTRKKQDIPLLTTCLSCLRVFEKFQKKCPWCGVKKPIIPTRNIQQVDGDLTELSEALLAELRGEIRRIDSEVRMPSGLSEPAQYAIVKTHKERQAAQYALRELISYFAGYLKHKGWEDSRIYRQFYLMFGIDILTAQTLGAKEANKLAEEIKQCGIIT